MYGDITHPTIVDIVLMILQTWDEIQVSHPEATWSELRFWKVDVSGAYTWLDFAPSDVYCMAQEMSNERIFISLVGVFGASIVPFAFNSITKAYRHEIKKITTGGADIYVDDGFGCTLHRYIPQEMSNACSILEKLIGEDCIKKEKNVHGTVVDALGWKINLDLRVVSIADKNLMKAMLCLFNIDLTKQISLVQLQRVSSYCSRYVIILEVMAPFLACIHRLMTGKVGMRGTFPISKEAKWAIQMWRAVFYLLVVDERHYGRPMVSFRPRPADYVIETDGSLSQVGIILYSVYESIETCIGGAAVSLMDFGFGKDSSYQNTAEYIGMVIGVLTLIKIGVRDVDVLIRGDSTTALAWMTEGRIKGPSAINAAVVVTALCIRFGIRPRYSVFLSGLDNHKADNLSRLLEHNKSIEKAMMENGHGSARIFDLRGCPNTNILINMCDPTVRIDDEDKFTSLWQTVRDSMEDIAIDQLI